jgi:hypothetical protein
VPPFMASNSEWVVPATDDARRFFMLDVSDALRSDHEYFATLMAQMEAGGMRRCSTILVYDLASMLRFLPAVLPPKGIRNPDPQEEPWQIHVQAGTCRTGERR